VARGTGFEPIHPKDNGCLCTNQTNLKYLNKGEEIITGICLNELVGLIGLLVLLVFLLIIVVFVVLVIVFIKDLIVPPKKENKQKKVPEKESPKEEAPEKETPEKTIPEKEASEKTDESAIEILKTRYVKGEITTDDFEKMKKDLGA